MQGDKEARSIGGYGYNLLVLKWRKHFSNVWWHFWLTTVAGGLLLASSE